MSTDWMFFLWLGIMALIGLYALVGALYLAGELVWLRFRGSPKRSGKKS